MKRITKLKRLKTSQIAFILYGIANCHRMKTCKACPIYRSNLPRICFKAKTYGVMAFADWLNQECEEQ